jgi:hypothetical protein
MRIPTPRSPVFLKRATSATSSYEPRCCSTAASFLCGASRARRWLTSIGIGGLVACRLPFILISQQEPHPVPGFKRHTPTYLIASGSATCSPPRAFALFTAFFRMRYRGTASHRGRDSGCMLARLSGSRPASLLSAASLGGSAPTSVSPFPLEARGALPFAAPVSLPYMLPAPAPARSRILRTRLPLSERWRWCG